MNKDCASEIRCRVSFCRLIGILCSLSTATAPLGIDNNNFFPLLFFCRWICRILKYESCCQVPVLNAIFPHLARKNSRKFQYIYSLFYLTRTRAKGIQDFSVIVAVLSSTLSQAVTDYYCLKAPWNNACVNLVRRTKMNNVETTDIQSFRLENYSLENKILPKSCLRTNKQKLSQQK